jgi:hypothetical protein
MLPGSALGIIVGFATQRYGDLVPARPVETPERG